MIVGIGTDIIEIKRVEKAVSGTSGFLNKVYTEDECAYFEKIHYKPESMAGTFAAKEAVCKALGTGFRTFGPKEIEVLREPSGKPYIRLIGSAKDIARNLNIKSIHISISHCKEYAVAYAVAEGCD